MLSFNVSERNEKDYEIFNNDSVEMKSVYMFLSDSPCSDTYIEADDSTDELDSTQGKLKLTHVLCLTLS